MFASRGHPKMSTVVVQLLTKCWDAVYTGKAKDSAFFVGVKMTVSFKITHQYTSSNLM